MESNFVKQILLHFGLNPNVKLFRNNTGMGWQGKVISHNPHRIIIDDPRPLNAGLCKGSSDLIGWTIKTITPEDVGKKFAVFTAIEAKSKTGKITDEQVIFGSMVQKSGGYFMILRETDDLGGVEL